MELIARWQNGILALLKAGARGAASDTARARLQEVAEFYEVTLEALESALRHWAKRKRT